MARRKKRKSLTQNDREIIRFLNITICIILTVFGLFHNRAGWLGNFIFRLFNFFFGKYIAVVILLVILLFLLAELLNVKIRNTKYLISASVILNAVMMILSIPKDHEKINKDMIVYFLNNYKSFFNETFETKGGLLGTLFVGGIGNAANFAGVIIVIVVLLLLAIIISVDVLHVFKNTKDSLKKSIDENRKMMQIKKAQQINDKKQKELNRKIDKSEKIEKAEKAQQFTPVAPVVKPVVKDEVKEIKPVETVKKDDNIYAFSYETYNLPRLSYLDAVSVNKKNVNSKNAIEKWNQLKEILDNFGLPSSLSTYNIGPSVTQFEIVPDGTFNIKKYSSIYENIKMELAVKDVRIEAPIPGKKAIGIEIPNVESNMVRLKELLTDVPAKYADNPLTIAVGKNLAGENVYGNIDKFPHLLIAGATGSGKSVCINSIILTILLRTKPNEVKLLLIDPKRVEFKVYENIPHLVCPIINDTSKAANALKKLVDLMEQRYELMESFGVKNISEYNKTAKVKMENIVCIIDELADLMATHKNDVEIYISRLAAKARASGIYLILATQRPSTDVITGTIKSNIVSRIAFAVSSAIDSRIIIDRAGAEGLFGNGDMLYNPAGMNDPQRIQGVYVSDDEIKRVVEYFTKSNYKPQYKDIFIVDDEEEAETNLFGEKVVKDPMYDEIKKFVMTQKTISASGLQRRCGLGFPRAAKIIDQLEQDGIISGSNGSKPRDVLVHSDVYEQNNPEEM